MKTHLRIFNVFEAIVIYIILAQNQSYGNRNDAENKDYCINKEIYLSRTLNISKTKTAWVIDHSLSRCLFSSWLEQLLTQDDMNGYAFNQWIQMEGGSKSTSDFVDALWSKDISLKQLKRIPGWKKFFPFVERLINKKIKIVGSRMDLFQALDPLSPFYPNNCQEKNYKLLIFINDMWNLNDYAQVSFYDVPHNNTDKTIWEITETVHPHPYRALLWPECQAFLLRAPCINRFTYFRVLNIDLSVDPEEEAKSNSRDSPDKNLKFSKFQLSVPEQNVDFSKHLFKSFNDGNVKRQVNVFDNIFTADELKRFLDALLEVNPLLYDFDSEPLEEHDNILRVGVYKVEDFIQTGMWPRLMALCEFVSNHTGWFPYDVAMNHVRFSDHNRIHPDSKPHQDELTMVLYLSENFSATDYGETTFYVARPDDGVHGFIGEGGNLFEAIGSVAPKFGRVTIFTNNIEHSAHPPSSKYPGCRYTFAVKVARSRRLALIKMVYEGMEALDMNPRLEKLRSSLESGKLDADNSYPITSLEKLLKKISKSRIV